MVIWPAVAMLAIPSGCWPNRTSFSTDESAVTAIVTVCPGLTTVPDDGETMRSKLCCAKAEALIIIIKPDVTAKRHAYLRVLIIILPCSCCLVEVAARRCFVQ